MLPQHVLGPRFNTQNKEKKKWGLGEKEEEEGKEAEEGREGRKKEKRQFADFFHPVYGRFLFLGLFYPRAVMCSSPL